MKLSVFLSISLLFTAHGAFANRAINIDGEKAKIEIPQIKWFTLKGVSKTISQETTPDKEKSLQVVAENIGKTIYLTTKVETFIPLTKIDNDWKDISFWIKPDNSDAKVVLTINSRDKKNPYHTGTIKLLGEKWQKIKFKNLWNRKKTRLKLEEIKSLSFQIRLQGQKKCKFLIGPITINLKSGYAKLEKLKTATAYRTANAPILDGKLDDKCWGKAIAIKDFIWTGTKEKRAPTEVKICFDDNNIYFAAQQKLDVSKLRKEQLTRDMNVWQDDCFQVFINPLNDEKTWKQFIVNSINVKQDLGVWFDQIRDGFAHSKIWDGKWQSATQISKDVWTAEVAIPFSDLSVDTSFKDIMGMQIAFGNPSLKNSCSWTPTIRFTNPKNFGVLNLQKENVPIAEAKDIKLSFSEDNIPTIKLKVPRNGTYKLAAFLATPSGKVFKSSTEIRRKEKVFIDNYKPENGLHRLTIVVTTPARRAVTAFKAGPLRFNQSLTFGKDALCPRVKKITQGKGSFKIDNSFKIYVSRNAQKGIRRTAKKLQRDLLGFMQINIKINEANDLPENSLAVAKNNVNIAKSINDLNIKSLPKQEGYILKIKSDQILITGNSPAGLFYGMESLSQLERYAYIRNERFLKTTLIHDWPSIPNRVWGNWAQGLTLRRTNSSKKQILDSYYDTLNRFAIGTKFNRFGLNFADSIKYEKQKNQKINLYPKGEFLTIALLKDLSSYCRENYMEFIPCIHGPSHALWMTVPYPKLSMPGYSNWDADPTHPDFFDIYFSACDEIADAAKPKYFNPWLDEWWHQPRGKLTTKHKGKEKRDIFLQTVNKIHSYHKKAGRRMIMFSDMLQREHNGGKPYDNYLNADKLPRDIIIANWSGGRKALKTFDDLGYETWYLENRFKPIGADKLPKKNKTSGFGTINYEFLTPDFGYSYAPMLRGGDYAWNFGDGYEATLEDWMLEYGRNVMSMYSVMPNPKGSHDFKVIDISAQCNDSYIKSKTELFVKGIPQGKNNVGFIPTFIINKKKNNCILASNDSIVIPINAKAASLIFLQTQVCPKDKRKELLRLASMTRPALGIETGIYEIIYTDNSRKIISIRNGRNCGNWLPYKGRVTTVVENKYLNDVRYVWETGTKVDGQTPCLYQYEWVNPDSEKTITKIVFKSLNKPTEPMLFAVTLRKPLK